MRRLKRYLHAHWHALKLRSLVETVPLSVLGNWQDDEVIRRYRIFGGINVVSRRGMLFSDEPGSEVWYAAMLHELGHLTACKLTKHPIIEEAVAWAWAQRNAIEWTDEMNALMHAAIRRHIDAYFKQFEEGFSRPIQWTPLEANLSRRNGVSPAVPQERRKA